MVVELISVVELLESEVDVPLCEGVTLSSSEQAGIAIAIAAHIAMPNAGLNREREVILLIVFTCVVQFQRCQITAICGNKLGEKAKDAYQLA